MTVVWLLEKADPIYDPIYCWGLDSAWSTEALAIERAVTLMDSHYVLGDTMAIKYVTIDEGKV